MMILFIISRNVSSYPAYPDTMPINHMFFFADYHILVSDSPVCLQNCLDFIGKYFSDWKLCINMEKTDVLILMVKQLVKFCTDFIKTLNTK